MASKASIKSAKPRELGDSRAASKIRFSAILRPKATAKAVSWTFLTLPCSLINFGLGPWLKGQVEQKHHGGFVKDHKLEVQETDDGPQDYDVYKDDNYAIVAHAPGFNGKFRRLAKSINDHDNTKGQAWYDVGKYDALKITDLLGRQTKCIPFFCHALEKITGERFGLDVRKWQDWWIGQHK
jgi:hypothetical protein